MIKPSSNILIIQSKKSELKRVEAFLKEIFETYNLNEISFNKVFLCVSEAIVNSIVHGHRQNEDKSIKVQVSTEEESISVTITDEGEGFDTSSVPDPTSTINIKKESGRGIHIIKSISNSLSYNESGNSVKFQIKCK